MRSSDTAGNQQVTYTVDVSSRSFTYDASVPLTGITYPAIDGTYKEVDLTDITGTSNDPGANPSGISAGNVKMRLYYLDTGDTYYCGGTNFSSTTAPGDAFLNVVDVYSWNFVSSDVNWISDKDYYVEARALDDATLSDGTGTGNQGSVCTARHFIIDDSTPSSGITVPSQATVTSLPEISGTADSTLSGMDTVEIMIKRIDGTYGDNRYWSEAPASSWSVVEKWADVTEFNGGTEWYYDTAVSWNDNTKYRITSKVTDNAGNVSVYGSVPVSYTHLTLPTILLV